MRNTYTLLARVPLVQKYTPELTALGREALLSQLTYKGLSISAARLVNAAVATTVKNRAALYKSCLSKRTSRISWTPQRGAREGVRTLIYITLFWVVFRVSQYVSYNVRDILP